MKLIDRIRCPKVRWREAYDGIDNEHYTSLANGTPTSWELLRCVVVSGDIAALPFKDAHDAWNAVHDGARFRVSVNGRQLVVVVTTVDIDVGGAGTWRAESEDSFERRRRV